MKQVLPVLMSAVRCAEPKRLTGIASTLGSFLFRFGTVGQRRNNELETVLAKLAQDLNLGKVTNVTGVCRALQHLYPDDTQFESDFTRWSVVATGPKKKLAKFLLCELEATATGAEARYDANSLTLEHILPLSQGHDGLENRFGNYALLEKSLNHQASSSWLKKKSLYSQSQMFLTRSIQADVWNDRAIEERQKELAKLAVRRFRIASDDSCSPDQGPARQGRFTM